MAAALAVTAAVGSAAAAAIRHETRISAAEQAGESGLAPQVEAVAAPRVTLAAEITGGTWCVRVEGSEEPVQLLLRNLNPGIQVLEGGPVQVAFTRGGPDNSVCREVRRTGPGLAALTAKLAGDVAPFPVAESCAATSPDGSCSRREREVWRTASRVAAEVFPSRVAFTTRRDELVLTTRGPGPGVGGEPAYDLPEVVELLDRTEAELLSSLAGEELAALRDLVRVKIGEARHDLTAAAAGARLPPPTRGPRLARLDARQEEDLRIHPQAVAEREQVDGILDRLQRFLERLERRAAGNDLALDLCIESAPRQGFRFLMYPESYPRGAREMRTHGRLPAVYRGLYAYRLSRRGFRPVSCPDPGGAQEGCALLDLWDDDRPILRCQLVPEAAGYDDEGCRRVDGDLEECGRHGG